MIVAGSATAYRAKQTRGNRGGQIYRRGRDANIGKRPVVARSDAPIEERIPHRVRDTGLEPCRVDGFLYRGPDAVLNALPEVEGPSALGSNVLPRQRKLA